MMNNDIWLLLLFISILIIVASIIAFLVTHLLVMFGFFIGYYLKRFLVKMSFNKFDERGKASQTSGNQGWYSQYRSYLIVHYQDIWCAPIRHIHKLRKLCRITRNTKHNETKEREKKGIFNLSPKVLVDNVAQPTPKPHTENLSPEKDHVNHKQTEPCSGVVCQFEVT